MQELQEEIAQLVYKWVQSNTDYQIESTVLTDMLEPHALHFNNNKIPEDFKPYINIKITCKT